jgi:hypothetical protein
MADAFYSSPAWLLVRESVLARDGRRCSIARLLGGDCHGVLDVDHIEPRADRPDLELDEDNLVTVCHRHHPTFEALRRLLRILDGDGELPPCRHVHRYREGRLECERRRRAEMVERRAARLARA